MLTNLKHGLANQHGHQQKLLSERNIFLEGLTLYRGSGYSWSGVFSNFSIRGKKVWNQLGFKTVVAFLPAGSRYALNYVATSKRESPFSKLALPLVPLNDI